MFVSLDGPLQSVRGVLLAFINKPIRVSRKNSSDIPLDEIWSSTKATVICKRDLGMSKWISNKPADSKY